MNSQPTSSSEEQAYRVPSAVSLSTVIEQMNYCYMALTNIINSRSVLQYQTELDQLLNNLTIENIAGLDEIADFRESLMTATSDLSITEDERKVLQRVNTIRRDNAKYQALTNALSIPMLLIPQAGAAAPSPQLAFYGLLTAARATIDYTMQGNQLQSEELQSMWELKKRDLEAYKNLRLEAFRILVQLYKKYNLKEGDRLTEKTALNFSNIIQEGDPAKRLRLLLDNQRLYTGLIDWEYYVGMAYADMKQVNQAYKYLQNYISRRRATPLFREDNKLGLAALAMLSYNPKMDRDSKLTYIKLAKENLPNSGAGLAQIALQYQLLGEAGLGFDLMRSGLDNESSTDKDLLIWSIVQAQALIKQSPSVVRTLDQAVRSSSGMSVNGYLTYLAIFDENFAKEQKKLLTFEDFSSRHFNIIVGVFGYLAPPQLDYDNIKLRINSDQLTFNLSGLEVYRMTRKAGDVFVRQMTPVYKNAISREDLEDDLDFFKENPKAIPVIFRTLEEEKFYQVRQDINPRDIVPGGKLADRLSAFGEFTDGDLEDIREYCEEHQKKGAGIQLNLEDNLSNWRDNWFIFYGYGSDMPYANYALGQDKVLVGNPAEHHMATVRFLLNDMSRDEISLPFVPYIPWGMQGDFLVLKWSGPQNLVMVYKYNVDKRSLDLYSVQLDNATVEKDGTRISQEVTFFDKQVDLTAKPEELGLWDRFVLWIKYSWPW